MSETTSAKDNPLFRPLAVEQTCHHRHLGEIHKLMKWIDAMGRQGLVVTFGDLDPDEPSTWPVAAYRVAIPDAKRVTEHGVPNNKGPMLRADRPKLTREEARTVEIARIASSLGDDALLAIIDRLTAQPVPRMVVPKEMAVAGYVTLAEGPSPVESWTSTAPADTLRVEWREFVRIGETRDGDVIVFDPFVGSAP